LIQLFYLLILVANFLEPKSSRVRSDAFRNSIPRLDPFNTFGVLILLADGEEAFPAQPSPSTSNLLNVPGQPNQQASHTRTTSYGSSTSTSGDSPSTGMVSSDIGDSKGDKRELLKTQAEEDQIPNNPFAFTPKQLAKLHDPKDLDVLRAMGGLRGLEIGLRTDVREGLSPDEDKLEGQITLADIWHALESRKKEDVKNGYQTEKLAEGKDGDGKEVDLVLPEEPAEKLPRSDTGGRKSSLGSRRPTAASTRTASGHPHRFSDRIKVFSENRIPERKPKNIFQLMWMALHDKILVCRVTYLG
jgi:P-type Ca2+ transporter type 2C